MNLTPEQEALGRRNFLKAVAGLPALAALGGAAAMKGPVRGGPVRLGWIGTGTEGRVLLRQCDPAYGEIRAFSDVNPGRLKLADDVLAAAGRPPAHHYEDWREMLQKEDLEAVVVATPLWTHAEITAGCLEAGNHVLCEKMMAWDVDGCRRMQEAAQKSGRILEIGYQRFYNPVYQTAYEGIVKAGTLGDVYHARLVWHRNQNWRRSEEPPAPGFDPSRWGYPTFDHLLNWRLYHKYSKGLLAELGSHQVSIANWFFGGHPEAVYGSGGVFRFKDGREVPDHVYVTFEYPQGRTATFSSIESNAFDHYYEMFLGTKGTLIFRGETEVYLFNEGESRATGVEVSTRGPAPVLDASESRAAEAAGGRQVGSAPTTVERVASYKMELSEFCSAVRVGKAVRVGPERAFRSAQACIAAVESIDKKARVAIT